MNPLDEVQHLDRQVDLVSDLEALKPIFYRLDEIARQHPSDFDVQLAVGDVKQHLVTHGAALKQKQREGQPQPPPSPVNLPPAANLPSAAPPIVAAPPPLPVSQPALPSEPRPLRAPVKWKRALMVGAVAGSVVSIALIALLVNPARRQDLFKRPVARVQVAIITVPAGASVTMAGQAAAPGQAASREANNTQCTSNCRVALVPGNYLVTASLNGYEPASRELSVSAGHAASVSLALQPQPQALRIFTDLEQGKIVLDDQPPAGLVDGQFVLDSVAPGTHTVKIASGRRDATFSFEIADAQPPAVVGTVSTHNLAALLISSLGNHARAVTNSGPLKVALNGQAQDDASPAGIDLKDFQPGVDEIVVGEGKDQRNVKESFGPAPMLTAFLKSDVNAGTLIVSAGADDVRVFLNNKEYRRRTEHGQVRIQTLGPVTVRVAKDGFEDVLPQTAEVKKGDEVRLEFALKPLPKEATLQIHGGLTGAEVLLDQKSIGNVGGDGSFTYPTVAPGDHTIELRRDQYAPKSIQRTFQAGQTVALAGADVVLAPSNGTIKLTRTPPGAAITYRRADETETHEVRGNQLDLLPGSYIFSAKAPGYADLTGRVQVAGGETRSLGFTLERLPTAPPVVTRGIADFADPAAWRKDGDLWVHQGAGFIPYKLSSSGVYTFTVELLKGGSVFHGGRIRWCFQYLDSKNYLLFELDRKNFWAAVVENGKKLEREKAEHDLDKQKAYTIQIEVTPDHLVHKIRNGNDWIVLDSFSEPGRNFTQGKFGFLIQGNDEIGITDFKFTGK